MKQSTVLFAVLCSLSNLTARAATPSVDIPLNSIPLSASNSAAAAPSTPPALDLPRGNGTTAAPNESEGDRFVTHAAKLFPQQYQTVEAKIRQRIDLFETPMIGSGMYVQQSRGGELLSRLEMKLVLSNQQLGSYLQVSDGNWLWTYQDQGAGAHALSKIDLQRIRSAWERTDPWTRTGGISTLGLGGLPHLLDGLNQSFHFVQAEQAELGGLPVLIFRGTWQASKLAALLPDQKAALARGEAANLRDLPKQVPWVVELVLGRDDIFPYRVTYLRPAAGKEKKLGKASFADQLAGCGPIVTLELFEVKLNAPIEGQPFVYQPSGLEAIDKTEQTLKAFGLTEAPAPAAK
ncbi:MAG TPA: hypothetical protein VFE24_02170 [Pirellulales bacterium]|jgi:hypothetical protein|nr:hypothetical protein [Pirellulales bacterium]